MPKYGCRDCEEYKERGHNYCRKCGTYLRMGLVRHVRLATMYRTNERFCGYCGGPKQECACVR